MKSWVDSSAELHSAATPLPSKAWLVAIAVALVVALPVSRWMPHWTSWESGLWESLQNALLFTGAVWAIAAARRSSAAQGRALWAIAALFWLVILGRETAWGAVFTPPLSYNPSGEPVWSSRTLWYRPAISYVIGATAIVALVHWLRNKVWSRHLVPVLRQDTAAVVGALALFVLCMLVSTHAEGHGFFKLQYWSEEQGMVLEELSELLAYAALWFLQARMIAFLARAKAQP